MAVKFDVYLREKLQKIKIDAEVFGAYILGILEAEDENEEKVEALTDILSGVMVFLESFFYLIYFFKLIFQIFIGI